MIRILTSAAIAAMFVSVPALAEDAKKDEKSVVPYGIIQSKYWLHDGARDLGTEADVEILRVGLRGNHGIVKSGVEAELNGNNMKIADGTKDANGIVTVRAAWLGLALPTDTTFKLGRIRPSGAAGYGTDQTSTPQQYSGIDGLRVTQKIGLGEKNSLELGFGVFNSLRVLPYEGTSTKNNMRNTDAAAAPAGSWNKSEKALLANAVITVDAVKAQFWYGKEDNAIAKAKYTIAGETTTDADKAAIDGVEVAPLQHIEASLGYDRDNWGIGIFAERDIHGSHKNATLDASAGKLTVGTAVVGSQEITQTVYGAGGNFNSKEIGITNLFAKEDAITFGAAYTRSEKRVKGTSTANQKGADVNEITGSVGYSVNNIEVALGFANLSTSNKTFTNAKGEATHSNQRAYINAAWEF